jgi:pyruvate-formate lyase-activating enzyme
MSKSVIFYGAGKNAHDNYNKWIKQIGEPVCFVDADVSKHYTKFENQGSEWVILPLLEAINRHPDYELYLTQIKSSLGTITHRLLGLGVPKERIHYCVGYRESLWCPYLQFDLFRVFDSPTKFTTCGLSKRIDRQGSGNFKLDYKHHMKHIAELKELQSLGYNTHCDGCTELCGGIPDGAKRRKRFDLSPGLIGGDTCNFKCDYCYASAMIERKRMTEYERKYTYDLWDVVQNIATVFNADEVEVLFASGEITVTKYRNQILDLWIQKGWRGEINTNGLLYDYRIGQLLERGLVFLVVNMSSGTKETFAKIKGVDCYEKVCTTLQKYSKPNCDIRLQYLLSPGVNDNYPDANGFIELASSLCATVVVTSDFRDPDTPISEREYSIARHLLNACKEKELKFQISSFFSADVINDFRKEFL